MTTQEQAITQILAHVNSGKLLCLGLSRQVQTPAHYRQFYWEVGTSEAVYVEHPVTLLRLLTDAEAEANWPDCGFPFNRRRQFMYEAILD